MNDDLCGDWYEPDEEYSSQFPRAADEGGWGIDESMYTTNLDTSHLTPEQIAMAERLANEIENEQRSKGKQMQGGGGGGGGGAFNGGGMAGAFNRSGGAMNYHESGTAAFFQQQKQSLPVPPQQQQQMTFQQQQQQQQQQMQQPPPAAPGPGTPGYVTPVHEQFANEMKVVAWLKDEMQRVLNLIGSHGEPQPQQAARLLQQYTHSVTTLIPYSPKDVKESVIALFKKCNWDVLRRRAIGRVPPGGKTLCDLIYELGIYFCNRTKQQAPPDGFVDQKLAEYRAKKAHQMPQNHASMGGGGGGGNAAPKGMPIPQPGGHNGHGKGGYQGNRGGKGGYQGNRYNNNGKGGYQGGGGKGGKGGGYQGNRYNEGKGGKGGGKGGKGGGGYNNNNSSNRVRS